MSHSSNAESFSRTELHALLHRLEAELRRRGDTAQLYVVGGAAMAFAYDLERVTRDIDAVFEPKNAVYEAAEVVAAESGVESDWLNDSVKGPAGLLKPDTAPQTVYESDVLLVQVASREQMLAMKLYAGRPGPDYEDAAALFEQLGYQSEEEAVELLADRYPSHLLEPRHRYIAAEVAQLTQRRRGEDDVATQHQINRIQPPAPEGGPGLGLG